MGKTVTPAGISGLVVALTLCTAPALVRAQHGMAHGFRPGTGVHVGVAGGVQSFPRHYRGYHAAIVSSPGRFGVYWGHPHVQAYPYYGLRFAWGPYAPIYPNGYGPYPYWSYPYWYGYGPWTGPPRFYPQGGECDYRHEGCGTPGQQSPVTRSLPKDSVNPPPSNPDVEPPIDSDPEAARATKLVVYRLPIRREVQNAANALGRMPPSARQRWLASGRYSSFSVEEREILRRISEDRP